LFITIMYASIFSIIEQHPAAHATDGAGTAAGGAAERWIFAVAMAFTRARPGDILSAVRSLTWWRNRS